MVPEERAPFELAVSVLILLLLIEVLLRFSENVGYNRAVTFIFAFNEVPVMDQVPLCFDCTVPSRRSPPVIFPLS